MELPKSLLFLTRYFTNSNGYTFIPKREISIPIITELFCDNESSTVQRRIQWRRGSTGRKFQVNHFFPFLHLINVSSCLDTDGYHQCLNYTFIFFTIIYQASPSASFGDSESCAPKRASNGICSSFCSWIWRGSHRWPHCFCWCFWSFSFKVLGLSHVLRMYIKREGSGSHSWL